MKVSEPRSERLHTRLKPSVKSALAKVGEKKKWTFSDCLEEGAILLIKRELPNRKLKN